MTDEQHWACRRIRAVLGKVWKEGLIHISLIADVDKVLEKHHPSFYEKGQFNEHLQFSKDLGGKK